MLVDHSRHRFCGGSLVHDQVQSPWLGCFSEQVRSIKLERLVEAVTPASQFARFTTEPGNNHDPNSPHVTRFCEARNSDVFGLFGLIAIVGVLKASVGVNVHSTLIPHFTGLLNIL